MNQFRVLRQEPWKPYLTTTASIIAGLLGYYLGVLVFDLLVYHLLDKGTHFKEPPGSLTIGLLFLIRIPIALFGKMKIQTRVREGVVEKGLKIPFNKALRDAATIDTKTTKGLILKQGKDLYFELYALRNDDFKIHLERNPNRNPSLKIMQELKQTYLHNWEEKIVE